MSRVQTLTVAVAGVALLAPSASSAAEPAQIRPSRAEARRVAPGPAAGPALPAGRPPVAVPHRGRPEQAGRDASRVGLTQGAADPGPVTPGPATPASVTPTSVTPGPVTPEEATREPVTPAPAPPAPATLDGMTPDGSTQDGVVQEPVTPGPVTPAPATPGVGTQNPSAPAAPSPATPEPAPPGPVTAADLLAKVRGCSPVSRGRYRTDRGTPATVPVCGTREAVFWKADMDIDCDGRPGRRCNARTDPSFSSSTAFAQSDGRALSSEKLPYVVVPAPSDLWDYRDDGVRGGSVAAVVYRDKVSYAVVGDTGPTDIIGEASYAAAKSLGIDPDPRSGGTPSGVTYIVFKDSRVTPIEDRAAAVSQGERLAREFVDAAD